MHTLSIFESRKSHTKILQQLFHTLSHQSFYNFDQKRSQKEITIIKYFIIQIFLLFFLLNRFCKSFSNYLKKLIPEIQISLDHFTQYERLTKRPFENALNKQFINSGFKDKVLYFFLENNIPFQTLRSKSFKNMIRYCRK